MEIIISLGGKRTFQKAKYISMSLKSTFRILVVTDLVLILLVAVVGLVSESSLPEPLRAFEQSRAEADMTTSEWIIVGVGVPLIVAIFVASFGLMFFWRNARSLFSVTTILALLVVPFGGPYITTGFGSALESLSCGFTGFLLAIIYFSPIKEKFKKQQELASLDSRKAAEKF
jgi:hypothetical protein